MNKKHVAYGCMTLIALMIFSGGNATAAQFGDPQAVHSRTLSNDKNAETNPDFYIKNEAITTVPTAAVANKKQQGIEMVIEKPQYSKSGNEIVLEIINNGSESIIFGDQYIVERNENGIWSPVPFKDNTFFTMIGRLLNANGTYKQTIHLNHLAEPLIKGKYQVVKEFTLNDKKITLATTFEITDPK
jgi:hypothetical protein